MLGDVFYLICSQVTEETTGFLFAYTTSKLVIALIRSILHFPTVICQFATTVTKNENL